MKYIEPTPQKAGFITTSPHYKLPLNQLYLIIPLVRLQFKENRCILSFRLAAERTQTAQISMLHEHDLYYRTEISILSMQKAFRQHFFARFPVAALITTPTGLTALYAPYCNPLHYGNTQFLPPERVNPKMRQKPPPQPQIRTPSPQPPAQKGILLDFVRYLIYREAKTNVLMVKIYVLDKRPLQIQRN